MTEAYKAQAALQPGMREALVVERLSVSGDSGDTQDDRPARGVPAQRRVALGQFPCAKGKSSPLTLSSCS